ATITLGADSAAESLAEHYQRLEDRAKGGDTLAVFEPLITFSREVAAVINKWPFNRTGNAKSTSSNVAVANEINDPPKDALPVEEEAARQIRAILSARTAADAGPIRRLMAYHLAAESVALAGGPGTEYDEFNDAAFTGTSPWDIDATPPVADATVFNDADNNPAADDAERVANALAPLRAVFGAFNAAVADIIAASNDLEKAAETSVAELFGTYKNIIAGVNRELSPMPPSGAVVGAYAAVDDARGVWKAPANVSLNSVKDLTRNITADEQENLNVDTVAGKSINAIRPFTGKGILIWGARTLAGNDNEWRYVPVRRLYNMVEESVQKATSPVVFEPNDANTWTKVKTMIDNFLTRLWRDGALAGSKPEQAFFVRIGLGKTMTAIDILEGRLIIEIGLAAVRPAEFIILKFMHKLQEA
ncbi:MAG: phage tail sheath subtilisin-like domain-containing protein, partial [Proteobacteria bacterium]|nr:phage tail sheath subtilisin-like domain-containing protein [Pseudomonadota bacterium]